MIRSHYPKMLKDIPQEERAALTALSAKTYELTDILVNVARVTPGALKNQVQHFSERMLHGKNLQSIEY